VNDAHCHFFSPRFFETLARETGGRFGADAATSIPAALGFDPPGSVEALADRWVSELDRHGVSRAALIASVPGDEDSVATAVARHPQRFVGFFMINPLAPDAESRVRRALGAGLRGVCLFPAMQRYSLLDERVSRVVDAASHLAGAAVFVHCGVLSVGIRRKLGLPSRFEGRFGQPLDVQALASTWPSLPFIVPHFGAGLFREALMAADMSRNILLDTSSSNDWIKYTPGLELRDVVKHALRVCGPDRLLFGTDSSFFPRGWQRPVFEAQRAVMDALEIGASDRDLVLGGSFERLFPLSS
jgi:uncharacterized protein